MNIQLTNKQLKRNKRIRKQGKKLFLKKLRKTTSVNLVSKYTSMMDNASFLCSECGTTFTRRCTEVVSKRTLANNGNGCPNCKMNRGAEQSKARRTALVHIKLVQNGILFSTKISDTRAWYDFTFMKCGCKHTLNYKTLKYNYDFKCPSCNFNDKYLRPHTVYYIELFGRYKIGVTMGETILGGEDEIRTDFPRYNYRMDFENIRVIKTWENLTRAEAFSMERDILGEFEWARYNGDPLFADGTGTRELFTHDILGLDNEH